MSNRHFSVDDDLDLLKLYESGGSGDILQRMNPIESSGPFLSAELAIDEEATYRRQKLTPYYPDSLLNKKKIQIFDEMMNDSEIESAINTLKTIRLSSGWEIESASDNSLDKEISDFVQHNFENIEGSFDDDLREIMGAVEMGVSINELIWSPIESGKWKNKIGLQSIKSKNPKYFNIFTDDFSNIRENGIINISSIDYGKVYPTEKFIVYSFNKRYENVFGKSRLRALYDLWFLKQVFIRAWGIFAEKFGMPIPIIKHPPVDDATKTNLLNVLKQFRLESGLLLAKDLELEIKETTAKSGMFFTDSIREINDEIRKTILGQTLSAQTSQSGGGAYALGKVHFDILLFYEEQLGKDVAAKAINQQAIKRLVDYNYNNVTEYPRFKFKELIKDDISTIIDKYNTGVQNGTIIPIPEDEEKIRMWLHLPKRTVIAAIPSVQPEAKVPLIQTEFLKLQENNKKVFTGVMRRKFTTYEEATDFAEIKIDIEGTTEKYTYKSIELIREGVDNLIKQIADKRIIEDKKPELMKELRFETTGELKTVFMDFMVVGYEDGMKQARRELQIKKSKARQFVEIDFRNLKPEEAIRLFSQKSFDMAGVEAEYIKTKVKLALERGMRSGASTRDVVAEIQKVLEEYYKRGIVDEAAYRSHRIETIIRTNTGMAMNEGRRAQYEDPSIDGFVAAYQYSAILDDRVRPNHACLDERIYGILNPIWQDIYPINGYNCRCIVIPITADEKWVESSLPPKSCGPDVGFEKVGK